MGRNIGSIVADSATIKTATLHTWNAVDQPLTVIDAMGVITRNTYDASGNLTSGDRTVMSFNGDGNLASWQSAAGASMTLTCSGSPSLLA